MDNPGLANSMRRPGSCNGLGQPIWCRTPAPMIMRPPATPLASHMWRRTAGIEYAIPMPIWVRAFEWVKERRSGTAAPSSGNKPAAWLHPGGVHPPMVPTAPALSPTRRRRCRWRCRCRCRCRWRWRWRCCCVCCRLHRGVEGRRDRHAVTVQGDRDRVSQAEVLAAEVGERHAQPVGQEREQVVANPRHRGWPVASRVWLAARKGVWMLTMFWQNIAGLLV